MAKGHENLIPQSERTKDEQREIAKKGGIASGKARREKATIKKYLQALLENGYDGHETGAEALAVSAMKKAVKGDVKAMTFVRDTVGEKPVDNVQIATVDQEAIDDINEMLEEASNNVETETEKFIDK